MGSCYFKTIALTILWVLFVMGAFICMNPQRKLGRVAEEAHQALMEGDAAKLLSLTSDDEIEALGLTEQTLDRYMNDYVLAGAVPLTAVPEEKHYENDFPSVGFEIPRDYRTPDGRQVTVSFRARSHDGSTHIDSVVWTLFLAKAALEKKGIADLIERDIDLLNATGVKATYSSVQLTLNWLVVAAQERDSERRSK